MSFPVWNIREVCAEKGITIAEVERALKIGNGVIAKWEFGKRYPPLDRIEAIADYLEVPVSRLTGIEKSSPAVADELYEKISLLSRSPDLLENLDRFVELAAKDPNTAKRFLVFAVQELESGRSSR